MTFWANLVKVSHKMFFSKCIILFKRIPGVIEKQKSKFSPLKNNLKEMVGFIPQNFPFFYFHPIL